MKSRGGWVHLGQTLRKSRTLADNEQNAPDSSGDICFYRKTDAVEEGDGVMRTTLPALISAFGVPALGLGVLLLGLSHSGPSTAGPRGDDVSRVYLLEPSARMDKSMTVCLRQEAKNVVRCRGRLRAAEVAGRHFSAAQARWRREGLAQAVDNYNLVARECTPAVFQATHLPPIQTP